MGILSLSLFCLSFINKAFLSLFRKVLVLPHSSQFCVAEENGNLNGVCEKGMQLNESNVAKLEQH